MGLNEQSIDKMVKASIQIITGVASIANVIVTLKEKPAGVIDVVPEPPEEPRQEGSNGVPPS